MADGNDEEQTREKKPEKGDMIVIKRKRINDHFSIYIGDGEVVHYYGSEPEIRVDKIDDIRCDSMIDVIPLDNTTLGHKTFSSATIVERAMRRLSQKGYPLWFSNSEDFANYCRFGDDRSEWQVIRPRKRDWNCLKNGEIFVIKRKQYPHFAIYIGNGKVIHYYGSIRGHKHGDKGDEEYINEYVEPIIREDKIDELICDSCWEVIAVNTRFTPGEIVERANRMLGKSSSMFEDSDHFAAYCRFGDSISKHGENEKDNWNWLEKGDCLVLQRKYYKHFAIYIGDGNVIHFTGSVTGKITGTIDEDHAEPEIRIDQIHKLIDDDSVFVVEKEKKMQPEMIVARGMERLGERGYQLLFNNCEHFANYCRFGDRKSEQVTKVTVGLIGSRFKPF